HLTGVPELMRRLALDERSEINLRLTHSIGSEDSFHIFTCVPALESIEWTIDLESEDMEDEGEVQVEDEEDWTWIRCWELEDESFRFLTNCVVWDFMVFHEDGVSRKIFSFGQGEHTLNLAEALGDV